MLYVYVKQYSEPLFHFLCDHRAKELAFLLKTGLLVTLLMDGGQL